MKCYFLGIDTSCYTTSCAIIDDSYNVVGEARKILEVKPGAKGLKQSEMVFQHTKALASLLESLPQVPLTAVGVSAFPRREENSYMPAFLVGLTQARTISHFMNVPLYVFSHQENHIWAALRNLGTVLKEPFFTLHLSGGTTEVVHCVYHKEGMFNSTVIGKSSDLHCGQFVDRIGVALGLNFPAGKELEQLALSTDRYDPLPSSVKDGIISLSGPCSEALRRIEKGAVPSEMGRAVFSCIGNSLEKMLTDLFVKYPVHTLVAVGGVMSNSILRGRLETFCHRNRKAIYFADPCYSVDNATGNAFGAAIAHAESK